MGNTSNREQWAVRERLTFIERVAWWRGAVNRSDVRELFGISAAQASSDLQAYQDMNPGVLVYNVRAKRYEAGREMACVLHAPHLGEAVRNFLGEGVPLPQAAPESRPEARADVFVPPMRAALPEVERRIFLAVEGRRRLRIKYWSVRSGRGSLREIAPHALGSDGYRWHARAWCFEDGIYKDFALSRVEMAEWPGAAFEPPVADDAWTREVVLRLVPHRDLDEGRRKMIERDYGMVGGFLKLRVREAMVEYCLAHLRIPTMDEDGRVRPQHLELDTRIQNPETRDQRSEIWDQRSEIRDQRSEIRDLRSGIWERRRSGAGAGGVELPDELLAGGLVAAAVLVVVRDLLASGGEGIDADADDEKSDQAQESGTKSVGS